ncbi:hypothetical protein ACFQVC_12965 [Streptomyces monticola]|uniref:Chromosome partitioning protein n=1 Tax=Streptomyces monticola TaxID=2666263 RepID=A0ABW2JGE1_9ACTN
MRKLIALGSLKGAPGVSTLALALAATWPAGGTRRPVVAEADAAGGDFAVRFGLPDTDGLLALAAGARHAGADAEFDACTQHVAGDVPVIVAPNGADQAFNSVTEVADRLSVLTGDADSEGTVLLDLGRLGPAPSRQLARAADRMVLVARGRAEALADVAARPGWLDGADPELAVVGPCRYSAADIAMALDMEQHRIHLLPWDDRAGAALSGQARVGERRWRRSPLAAAASGLARQLAGGDEEGTPSGLRGELARLGTRALPAPVRRRPGAVRALEKGGTQ